MVRASVSSFPLGRREKEGDFLADYVDILVVLINLILFQYSRFRGIVISIAKRMPPAIDCLLFSGMGVVQSYAGEGP